MGEDKTLFHIDVGGSIPIFLCCHAIIWGALFTVLQFLPEIRSSLFGKKAARENIHAALETEDPDVAAERQRVEQMGDNERPPVKLLGIRKEFGNFTAVSNSTFAIPNGQCFGLLGSNGAGKTTTIKMLQGELSATAGDAWIMGESVVSNRRQVQLSIGVCPQFDGLHDKLTVREHLELYARLKGVEASRIDWVVENFLQFAKLDFKADENTAGLSGGNKRKLSLALAMLGGPQVLFRDEPSSGISLRRFEIEDRLFSQRIVWKNVRHYALD